VSRIGFQGRILGYFGLLVAATLIGSLWLVDWHVTNQVRQTVRDELETAQRVFDELLDTRANALITAASLVTRLPVLHEPAHTWDPPFLEYASREINRLVGSEVVLITDRSGVILGRSDRRWELGDIFDETTSVARALRGERASSMWIHEDKLYQMVSVPLRLPTGLAGTLSVGFRVDGRFATELSLLSGNDIAFLVGSDVVASSRELSPHERAAISDLAGRVEGVRPAYGEVELHGKAPALVVRPFVGIGPKPVGAYAILRSLSPDALALRALERRLVLTAGFVFLAALAAGFLLTRSVARPLSELAVAAHELGAGNYDAPLPPPSGGAQVEELTRAFESMRRSLKERIGELRELTAHLEEMVRERTSALEDALAENRRLLETLRRWNDELERKVEVRTRELADAQQMLIRQDRMAAVGRLAAGVAHEINNPLGILSGFAEGLLDRAADPRLAAEPSFTDFPGHLRLIVDEVDRLKTIVQKFLNFARSKSPQKRRMDVNDVARQVLELLANHSRIGGKHLAGAVASEPLWVDADPEQLKQVLLNLTLNGLDAIDRGGRVTVRTLPVAGFAELRVEDDGAGVPVELRERVFEPFFSTKPPEKGTGLGLSLCHDLVRENGGELELHDPARGAGTVFVVRLALAEAEKLRARA
jgi:signal transduction histidine kinase